MSKKSWRDPNKKIEEQPQKFKWNSHKVFDDFISADEERKNLLAGKQKYVKIHRCGPDGTKFKVKVGHPVKAKNKNKSNNDNL